MRDRRSCTGLILLLVPLLAVLSVGAALGQNAGEAAKAPPGPVDFDRSIRPLLTARCVGCHGEKVQKAGLRLDLRQEALDGGDSGPAIVPGRSGESELIRRVTAAEPEKVMPPGGKRLSAAEVALLRAWIDAGAAYGVPPLRGIPGPGSRVPGPSGARDDQGPGTKDQGSAKPHWAFRPVIRPPVPKVRNRAAVYNPIDAFVVAELEKHGLRPSPPADRTTLIRRVSLDLTGLPPAPEEVDAFLNDHRPGAYERLVDRLLASPHYGERWARHWLDQARYADSNGYTIDSVRSIWPYRDWVIRALNADMPFDRFTIEQIAGDLLPDATPEQRVATGFHRNTLFNEEGGTDREQFRVEAVADRVDTTGAVFLGLTLGCARCHTHKYDPITQKEYYRLFAFFNSADEPALPLPTPEQAKDQAEVRARLAAAQKALAEHDRTQSAPELREILGVPAEKRTAVQKERLAEFLKSDPRRAETAAEVARLQARDKALEQAIPATLVLQERREPRETHLMIRGDFLRKGARVTPGVPAVLPPLPSGSAAPTRLDFAQWLVDGKNPLTPRVTVNRIWQAYFGTGLVETENDFGAQGTLPTHPELLDWLAAAFVAGAGDRYALGWSFKRLHRLIVTSATYRQSSKVAEPDNPKSRIQNPKRLARQVRLRLDAETVRDNALAASGLLSRKIGGPSVFPPQPGGIDLFTQTKKNWKASEGEDRYRRGLYTFIWRSNPYPLFATFDAPGANVTCTRRARSNTPLQALMLANDQSLFEMAQGLAARVLREAPVGEAERIRYAFRCCLAREPSAEEAARLLAYYRSQLTAYQAALKDAESVAPRARPEGVSAPEGAAWTSVARVIMNLDEFITRE